MSTSVSAFIGPGSFVYKCKVCRFVVEYVNKLKIDTDIEQSVILCCPQCEPFIGVDKIDRDYHQAVLESSRLSEASQPTLEGVPSDEGTPSLLRESKQEEQADDGMDFAEDSPIVYVQATAAVSSKSEEVLFGIQNMSINDSVASSRVIDN